ncbi:MAG: U32 family peptidase [Planctomycetota bacterium]|nr:MAG: U32 family peptidase [Planctomycetota bacterium]
MAALEILAPAGCLQRLRTAVAFGADAVFIGGARFGLRKHADNFSEGDMARGIAHAHRHGVKVYVTCNVHPLERDWPRLKPYLAQLNRLRPDALIVADPGVAAMVIAETGLRVHVSTQASVTNQWAAEAWRQRGAQRIVVARELSIEQAAAIRSSVGIEIEAFVHGAQCASYSGKCVISNYTAGRDANRGGCMQTCRHPFTVHDGASTDSPALYTSPLMNARDQMAIDLLPQFAAAGIDAAKIEGRMKSALYVAATVAAYRRARDGMADNPARALLHDLSNRSYGPGGLLGRPGFASINHDFDGYQGNAASVGQVVAWDDGRGALIPLRKDLGRGDVLQLLRPDGSLISHALHSICDTLGRQQDRLGPNRAAWVQLPDQAPPLSVAWVHGPSYHSGQGQRYQRVAS